MAHVNIIVGGTLSVHLAYKLAGAVDHVTTGVVKDESLYHHPKVYPAFFGIQSDVIFPFHTAHVNATTTHVHPFECIVIIGV